MVNNQTVNCIQVYSRAKAQSKGSSDLCTRAYFAQNLNEAKDENLTLTNKTRVLTIHTAKLQRGDLASGRIFAA